MKKKLIHYWLKFKRDCLSYPIAYFAKFALKMILATCKVRVNGLNAFVSTAQKEKCIIVLWHNRLAILAEVLNTHAPQFIYTAFISKSRDGEPLAHLANSYAAGRAIRVPHNAKYQALKMVIENLKHKKEIILFTPDGPRGPKYKVKPGIAIAARETNAAVVPFTWTANKFWTLKTWDGFMLPKPFATIDVQFGNPFYAQEGADVANAMENLEQLSK